MDLQLFGRVLWLHRVIVGFGLVLVCALTAFSMLKYTDGHFAYRQQEKWQTTSKILVTQSGFPEGRVAVGDDPDRFVKLAYLYASFIDADPVRRLIEQKPFTDSEQVFANAIVVEGSGASLPIIDITGIAATAPRSAALTANATSALLDYISRNQARARIKGANRVVVQLIQSPHETKLVQSRPVTLPIMTFLASLSLVFGFVFVLDNVRRSRDPVAEDPSTPVPTPVSAAGQAVPVPAPAPVAAVTEERAVTRRWQVEPDEGDETWGSRQPKRRSS